VTIIATLYVYDVQIFLQEMVGDVRFAFSVDDTTHAVYN
jgi:hypothetical protein